MFWASDGKKKHLKASITSSRVRNSHIFIFWHYFSKWHHSLPTCRKYKKRNHHHVDSGSAQRQRPHFNTFLPATSQLGFISHSQRGLGGRRLQTWKRRGAPTSARCFWLAGQRCESKHCKGRPEEVKIPTPPATLHPPADRFLWNSILLWLFQNNSRTELFSSDFESGPVNLRVDVGLNSQLSGELGCFVGRGFNLHQ